MTFDKTQFMSRGDETARKPSAPSNLDSRFAFIEQAAVSIESVTGHQDWDRFLSYVQEAIERFETLADDAREMLCRPSVVNHDQMLAAKISLAEALSARTALEAVINLPKGIMETKEELIDEIKNLGTADKQAA